MAEALERKNISHKYHNQDFPVFLKANGPFDIYDHAKIKGQQSVENINSATIQAQGRF